MILPERQSDTCAESDATKSASASAIRGTARWPGDAGHREPDCATRSIYVDLGLHSSMSARY